MSYLINFKKFSTKQSIYLYYFSFLLKLKRIALKLHCNTWWKENQVSEGIHFSRSHGFAPFRKSAVTIDTKREVNSGCHGDETAPPTHPSQSITTRSQRQQIKDIFNQVMKTVRNRCWKLRSFPINADWQTGKQSRRVNKFPMFITNGLSCE